MAVATGPTAKRLALAEQAQALRLVGLLQREIAALLGISTSYADTLLNDPLGAKQRSRRKGYQGECVDCGAATDGSNGRAKAPERCLACRKTYEQTELLYWTPERLIEAAQRWYALFGYPPAANSWTPARMIGGYRFPNCRTCYRRGGNPNCLLEWETWGDFLEAAGFPGYHGRGAGNYRSRRAAKAAA